MDYFFYRSRPCGQYPYSISKLQRLVDIMTNHQVRVDFDGVITAEQVKSYKPSYGHWQQMLRQFNAKKEEVLHVAASYIHDIIPAKEQGFEAVWINRNNEEPIREIKPDTEFRDLRPLPDVLH